VLTFAIFRQSWPKDFWTYSKLMHALTEWYQYRPVDTSLIRCSFWHNSTNFAWKSKVKTQPNTETNIIWSLVI
jgi:hypothetical protein